MKVAEVARQLSNLISNKSIVEDLQDDLKNLQDQRQRLQENLSWDSEEEFQTQNSWLKNVDQIVAQVNAFLSDNEGKSTCTNFLWRYNLSKKSRKMQQDISKLYVEGQSHLSVKAAKDYKVPKSRSDTINEIMEALKEKDPLIRAVGVWGLGGVGTTSLAKHIGRQAKEQDLFNAVIVITVTEKPNVEQVQGVIAAALGVHFNEESLVKRRNKLRQRIKNEKNTLVIVDDTWGELNPQEFDLEEFGVPLGEEHAGSKLLLTSGNLNFIQNLKGAPKPKVFQLEKLQEEEAQSLFEKMVEGAAQDPKASDIAREILKSCEGSASSFFAIAKALRNKGQDAWQKASEELKNVSPVKLLSNSLENEELSSLFLLLTIRGRKAINKYSIYIDMWTSLFKNLETADAARNRRDSLISDLKSYGLLVEDEKQNVKINYFMWHAAYSIAQNDLKASMIYREWPPEDRLEGLCFCNINTVDGLQLPERLQCPNLQQLVISTESPSMQVPDSFFHETKLLEVLHFVGFECSKLPVSFVWLKKLEALYLSNCKLGDITKVGELTNLRVLSLLGSSIQQLPAQIDQLQKLLFLDLTDTNLQVIPPNVLSKLTRLEELYLRNSFCNWEIEISTNEKKNASLKELINLEHLAYIEDLYVPDPRAWPMDLFFGKLKSYTIFIGDKGDQTHGGGHGLKTLKLKLNRMFQSEDGIKKMLKSVNVLYLDELNGVQNVLSDLDCDVFPHLQSLFIQNNAEIKCIATGSSHDPLDAFPNLESLSLNKLSNLENICHGVPLSEKSFFKLRVIKVKNCNATRCLFSKSMIKGLPHLANIEVSECKSIKAIVLMEGEENPPIEFPDLCSLTLQGLPALISFCLSEGSTSSSDAPILFHNKVSCPNLETMLISKVNELTTLWNEEYDVENSFWKLKNVNITECEKLRTVFPVNISKNLHNLKILEVRDCSSMTSIFTVMRQDNKQPGLQLSLPMIYITLFRLPKLEYVCVATGFESLKTKFEEEWQDGISTLPDNTRAENERKMKKYLEDYLNM